MTGVGSDKEIRLRGNGRVHFTEDTRLLFRYKKKSMYVRNILSDEVNKISRCAI